MLKIGILALQGGIEEHQAHLKRLNVKPVLIKRIGQLANCDGLILPGGESTAIGKTLLETSIDQEIRELANKGLPIWGTCAGMILLANEITGQNKHYLQLLDIVVCRNGFGRQLGSFSTSKMIPKISDHPLPLIFIRAPYIREVGKDVRVLLKIHGKIVAVQQKNILATSFHPELTDNLRFHQYFLQIVSEWVKVRK